MTTNHILVLTVFITLITGQLTRGIEASECNKDNIVYGQNEIIDQLMVCSLSKSYDLDLTPRGEYLKSTSRALVDQGLSNKTSILYAKLNGLWSGKRTKFLDSAWRCEANKTTLSSVIEFTGLSLELIERLELPMHQNQHKLSLHKPCKTFDLPTWMCRSSRPIYRTTTTWVNSAYLNVTLSQARTSSRPLVEKISVLFTCPETFKQKVTHSPSAMYILSKYMNQNQNTNEGQNMRDRRDTSINVKPLEAGIDKKDFPASVHGNGQNIPTPGYHNSVHLIMNHLTKSLANTLRNCINLLDLNLMLVDEYKSFSTNKLNEFYDGQVLPTGERINNINNLKCSDKLFISQRIELAIQAEGSESSAGADQSAPNGRYNQMKRSQYAFNTYPNDPDQLLDPFGYYQENNQAEASPPANGQ